jgi:hypothetical protein
MGSDEKERVPLYNRFTILSVLKDSWERRRQEISRFYQYLFKLVDITYQQIFAEMGTELQDEQRQEPS